MTKRLIILSVAFLLLGFQLTAKPIKGFVVNGSISGLNESYVYLAYIIEGSQKFDSAMVKNGLFSFKGSLPEPCVAMLYNTNHRLQRLFYLDNTTIRIQGKLEIPTSITVLGSKGQFEYESLQTQIQANRTKAIAASDKMTEEEKKGNSALQKQYKILFDSLYKYEHVIIKNFIRTHPQSYLSANQLYYQIVESNVDECKKLYETFSPTIKQSYMGKEIATRFNTLGKIQIGKQALDFTQRDTLGNPVSLSTYKGKYVLLEFWASWCGPCRAEGPNVLKAYEKFKDKGLVILAVSLDKDINQWKKAIRDDHMPWIHVSDLKYWKNEVADLYGVHAVPANFLISPEGKIIAKDLRGEALQTGLAKILN